MPGSAAKPVLPVLLALLDGGAIVVFVTIGLVSHRRGLNTSGYARDTLPLAGGWFAAAAVFRPYSTRRLRPLLATWAFGISIGVLVRSLALGRPLDGSEAAFLAVCLVTIGLLVITARGALLLARVAMVRG